MINYILPNTSVQHQWDHLQNFLQNLMKQFIPTKVSRPQKHRPWITRELITDTHRRDRAYAAWNRMKSEEKHQIFLKLRSMCQRKIRKAHKDYVLTIFDSDSSPDGDKTAANKRFLYDTVKVLCYIPISKDKLSKYGRLIWNTWGHHCNKLIFFAEKLPAKNSTEFSLPIVDLQIPDSGSNNLTDKMFASMQY